MTSAPGDARERYSTLLWRLTASGQWERALTVAGDWLAEEPASTDAHQAAGQALIHLHRYESAAEHLQRTLAAKADSGFVHRLASIAYFYLEIFPRADHHIMEAIRLQPNDAMHWYHLALMGYKHRYFDAAAGYARRSLELSPNNADTINLLALCERRDVSQRLRHYQHALALDPENAVIHNNLGVYHLNETRNYAQAAECFRRALAINPVDPDAKRNLVLTFRTRDTFYQFIQFPNRFIPTLAAKAGQGAWGTIVAGLVFVYLGFPILLTYGIWLVVGLPLFKGYEYLTLPDVRERAGIVGARRGGVLGFWRWPRWVRVGLFVGLYLTGWAFAAWPFLRDLDSRSDRAIDAMWPFFSAGSVGISLQGRVWKLEASACSLANETDGKKVRPNLRLCPCTRAAHREPPRAIDP